MLYKQKQKTKNNRMGGLIDCVLISSAIDRRHTKDYEIGICCFYGNHTALRRKCKDWLTRNHDNDMCWSGATYLPADCSVS